MRIGWKIVSPIAAAVAVGMVLVGYTVFGGADEPELEVQVGPAGLVTAPSDIALPLDAYVLSRQLRRVNSTAISILGRDCMRRLGFEWPIPDRTPPVSEEPDNARRYGLVDDRHAATYGYNPDPAEAEYNARVRAVSQQIPNDALVIWTGDVAKANGQDVPDGGCGMDARRKIGVAPEGLDDRLVETLAAKSFSLSERHPTVQAALKRWSTCMEKSGFRYQGPWETATETGRGTGDAPAGDMEIATATADVACNREANLAGVWLAAESAYQRRLIEDNAAELNEMKQWRDRVAQESARAIKLG